MDIADLISRDHVFAGLRVGGKAQLLDELARRAAPALGIGAQTIADALAAREALGSTGVGQGIAMPHARIPGLGRLYGLFVRLDQPIDFAAIDEQKVDLVFLLLTPAEGGTAHLTALALVSRDLSDTTLT